MNKHGRPRPLTVDRNHVRRRNHGTAAMVSTQDQRPACLIVSATVPVRGRQNGKPSQRGAPTPALTVGGSASQFPNQTPPPTPRQAEQARVVSAEAEGASMVRALDSYSSIKDVAYSCGYCGYALNLSSSTRNTANIGSKYGKQIKKGVVSFFAIDESRFTQTDEVSCMPYFHSSRSWGLFRNRTRLLCRKCSGHIGNAYDDEDSTSCEGSDDLDMSSKGSSTSTRKKYVIKINALQPSSDDDCGALFSP